MKKIIVLLLIVCLFSCKGNDSESKEALEKFKQEMKQLEQDAKDLNKELEFKNERGRINLLINEDSLHKYR